LTICIKKYIIKNIKQKHILY